MTLRESICDARLGKRLRARPARRPAASGATTFSRSPKSWTSLERAGLPQHRACAPDVRADDFQHRPLHFRLDARRALGGHEPARVHEPDPAGPLRLVQVGGGHHDGDAFAQELGEDDPELAAGNRIHARGGLVQEDDAGPVDEGAGQGELLFHASGQLLGEPAAEGEEPGEGEELFPAILELPNSVDPGEELDVLVHREVPVEGKALGEVADLLLDPWKVLLRGRVRRSLSHRPGVSGARTGGGWSSSFPAPSGPTRANISFASMRRSMPLTDWTLP